MPSCSSRRPFHGGLRARRPRGQEFEWEQQERIRVLSCRLDLAAVKPALISLSGDLHKAAPRAQDLVNKTGEPSNANIAVFTNATNDHPRTRSGAGLRVKTIWGEIAYQLGGSVRAYSLTRNKLHPKAFFPTSQPSCGPALILIDELADYCISLLACGGHSSQGRYLLCPGADRSHSRHRSRGSGGHPASPVAEVAILKRRTC